jgi:hypothetical protein
MMHDEDTILIFDTTDTEDAFGWLTMLSQDEDEIENFCVYGHYEEFNDRLPQCVNEFDLGGEG